MIGFIGGGNMAEALIKGMTAHGMRGILVSEPVEARRAYLASTYGVRSMDDNTALVAASDIVLLAVKPQQMDAVLKGIAGAVVAGKVFVSIAAGITLKYLQDRLGTTKIVRVMPNVASMVQEGMAVLSLCDCFPDGEIASVRDIFMCSGRVLTLPEKHMDAVTALSGSGPAFIAYFLGAMMERGVELGLGPDDARELGVQTLIGTARLLDGELTTERLIAMVKSPGGTTEAGLKVAEERGLKETVKEIVTVAARRSGEMAR